MQYISTSLLDF